MKINIGDKVKVIDQDITGEVIRFDGQKIVILDDEPGQDLEEGDEPTLTFRADQLKTEMKTQTTKEHTLNRHEITEAQYLQEAWKEGKAKGLKGDDLFNYTEKRSLELWNNTAR